MLANADRTRHFVALPLALSVLFLPMPAAARPAPDGGRFRDSDAIREAVASMVQAVADRDAAAFGAVFTVGEEAMLWDQELRFVGAPAIQAWMTGLLLLVPEAAVYSASAPRIILRPDGDQGVAWVSVDWAWAAWEGHATALLRIEDGEWRFYRVDFFGLKIVQPDADMDPTTASQTIGLVSAAADAASSAIAAGDLAAIDGITRPAFRFVEADGSSAADPVGALAAHGLAGDFDGFDPAAAVILIDAQDGVALVVDPDAPAGSPRLRLTLDDGGWLVDAAGLDDSYLEPPLDVSPAGRSMTTWSRLKGVR